MKIIIRVIRGEVYICLSLYRLAVGYLCSLYSSVICKRFFSKARKKLSLSPNTGEKMFSFNKNK